VGETTKGLTCRMFEHMAHAFSPKARSNLPKNDWLKAMFEEGLLPFAVILEQFNFTEDLDADRDKRRVVEETFIQQYRDQGYEVMNGNRTQALQAWWKLKGPEQRKISARKSADAITKEQRSEFSRLGKAKQSPERRKEIGRKISETLQALGSEERSRRAFAREEKRRAKKLNG
jgi:hypothetical protein